MRYEQTVQVETSEYICIIKRIDGLVIQKSLVSELIRCKDCKYWNGNGKYCDYEMSGLENDYCSWAERKEE